MAVKLEHQEIADFLTDTYGWQADSIARFAGEIQLNFKCNLSNTKAYNVKLFPEGTEARYIDFLCETHKHSSQNKTIKVASVASNNGSYIHNCRFRGKAYRAIVLEWVEGQLLSDLVYHPPEILQRWGEIAAQIQSQLSTFKHDYTSRVYEWDPLQLLSHENKIESIQSEDRKKLIQNIFSSFKKDKLEFAALPQSINHNDLHAENILVGFQDNNVEISGVIDFGDVLYTARINELAISCAYAMMGKKDILSAAGKLITGYTAVTRLSAIEIKYLEILIKARLSISVLLSANKRSRGITDPYQFVSEGPAWEVLEKLVSLPNEFIHYYFRSAAGFSAHPKEEGFNSWLNENRDAFSNVMTVDHRSVGEIDLSVGSLVIPSTTELFNVQHFERRISDHMEERGLDIAHGGYGELRPFYTSDNYEVENDEGYQWRTRHLGIDLWTRAAAYRSTETAVYCPYDGEVVGSYNNNITCDYGPTIIIKHLAGKLEFYTLYGHLSQDSLEISPKGKIVKGGEQLGFLGNNTENGEWPPHLHFQVMLSLLGNKNNFPGVCYDWEWDVWKSICPNPQMLIPRFTRDVSEQKSSSDLLAARKFLLGKNLSVSYNVPLVILRGHKQFLYDETGRRYLDTVNNVAHVGHEHPRLGKIAAAQIQLLNTNTRYLHPLLLEYAEKLLATLPSHLTRVYFTNSGSEANELALRLAHSKTHSTQRMVYRMGYHGNTSNTVAVSSYKFDRKGGQGSSSNTKVINYVSKDSLDSKTEAATTLSKVKKHLAKYGACTFIGESILSCAGQEELDKNFVQELYKLIQSTNGVCIADEVQTGFGRVGERFWAFQLHEVKPDIVTMGKPIGNGHPIGAVALTEELAELFNNGMEYFNTYGGNPVSMAIASTVLDIISDEHLQENASKLERLFYEEGAAITLPNNITMKCKGKGLFLGLEFHNNSHPATDFVSYIKNRMRNRGILMSSDGLYENILKIKPPMCFTEGDLKRIFSNLQLISDEYGVLIRD